MVDLREVFKDPSKFAGSIEVEGWIRNNRGSNKFGFIELNDGTYFKSVQVVYEEEFIDIIPSALHRAFRTGRTGPHA